MKSTGFGVECDPSFRQRFVAALPRSGSKKAPSLLRGFAAAEARAAARRSGADRAGRAVPPPGHARRVHHVCRDDQLRSCRLGIRPHRLPLRPRGSPIPERPGPRCPGRSWTSPCAPPPRPGSPDYDPDACLINRYIAGAKLGLHQDRDEKDAWAPIVSVSLGLPAVFLWGGKRRSDPVRRLRLESGDVAVWGGPARFVYHGVAPLKDGAASADRRRSHQSYVPKGVLTRGAANPGCRRLSAGARAWPERAA